MTMSIARNVPRLAAVVPRSAAEWPLKQYKQKEPDPGSFFIGQPLNERILEEKAE
ncbi:hypothetical protein [Paenibacillus sp. FJAT-26967]|uniref:hypothetical protein n=1 Tax=Paenibacillus sp. FJAT-26967 TaxID=1729690 RepID=UPI0015603A3E|nr:hypothetical protein [Paenibacillus sp. FJAT-26967]